MKYYIIRQNEKAPFEYIRQRVTGEFKTEEEVTKRICELYSMNVESFGKANVYFHKKPYTFLSVDGDDFMNVYRIVKVNDDEKRETFFKYFDYTEIESYVKSIREMLV